MGVITRTRLTILFLALAAAGLSVWFFRAPAIEVEAAAVGRDTMLVTIDEEGRTRIRDVFKISAPVSGRLLRSDHEVGDAVEEGKTVVAMIEPAAPAFLDARARQTNEALEAAAEAAGKLAAAEVNRARAQMVFAEKAFARARNLAQTNSISERDYERAQLELEVQKAALASAEASLELRRQEIRSAQARLLNPDDEMIAGQRDDDCCVNVRAPADGRILKIYTQSAQMVATGAPLLEIGNPADLEVVVELLSRDAVQLRRGAQARIQWGEDTMLTARLERIDPAAFTKISALGIEEQRVNAVFALEGGDAPYAGLDAGLGHEYRVYAYITLWQGEDILQAPLGALLRSQGQWAVFRIENGLARLRPVVIGRRNSEMAEIVEGLQAGDEIIMHPSDRISDGVLVQNQ